VLPIFQTSIYQSGAFDGCALPYEQINMVRFAEVFPDAKNVHALSGQTLG
jgi:hypothetical protein